MKCYWRTILLLLAIIISTSSTSTVVTESPTATVTHEKSTETSTLKITSTKATSSTSSNKTPGSTSSPKIETTTANITDETTKDDTEETSAAPASNTSPSSQPTGTSESTSATSTSASTPPPVTSRSSPPTTSESTPPTTNESTPPTTSESTPPTTSESTPPTGTSGSTSTGTSPSILPTDTNTSTPPPITSESVVTASSSVATTPAAPTLRVLISETNLLLANDSSRHFVEIQVKKNMDIDSVWLVIQNASVTTTEELLLKQQINISSFDNGLYLYNDTELSNILKGVDSVLIALYDNERNADQLTTNGLHDILLYSSSGNINPDLKKRFAINQNLIIDYEKLNISIAVSLSRCSQNETANSVAALTIQSPGKPNDCNFTFTKPLQMKLTRKSLPCSRVAPNDFQSALKDYVISDVNKNKQCGLAAYMMTDMNVNPVCISDGKELDVRFTVNSAFPDQVNLIKEGYLTFLSQKTLTIKEEVYDLSYCYEDCFDQPAPPASNNDDRVRVTVAVVVSCICVFLVVLLFVILYLRRKRRGVLQFHMTRLDEDDDLAGDMDDFVGNQGPTFRNYR